MKSRTPGKSTSAPRVEVENISPHGLWLFMVGREYFLSFDEFPWFRDARIGELQNVELLFDLHLHWPELDVDLELESLDHPEKYPLKDSAPTIRARVASKHQPRKRGAA